MVFYYNSVGELIKNEPQTIYQGSNKASTIYVVAPFTSTNTMTVQFELPNGEFTSPQLMTAVGSISNLIESDTANISIDGKICAIWKVDIENSVTSYAGTLIAQFSMTGTNEVATLRAVNITIARGTVPVLPETPSSAVYTQILSALATLTSYLNENVMTEITEIATTTTTAKIKYKKKNLYSGTVTNIELSLPIVDDESVGLMDVALYNELKTATANITAMQDKIIKVLPNGTDLNNVIPNTYSTGLYKGNQTLENLPSEIQGLQSNFVMSLQQFYFYYIQQINFGDIMYFRKYDAYNETWGNWHKADLDNVRPFDNTPTENSTNAVTSGGVFSALSTIKRNAFIKVNTTTYPTLNDFLASIGTEGYVYLYPINTSDLSKGYYQYIWEDSTWLSIGTTLIDLTGYYTKTEANGKIFISSISEATQTVYYDLTNGIMLISSATATKEDGTTDTYTEFNNIPIVTDGDLSMDVNADNTKVVITGAKALAITLATPSQTQGTITADQLGFLKAKDSNYIEINDNDGHIEKYYYSTEASEDGYRVYTHIEDEAGTPSIKSFTITESVRSWVIVETQIQSKLTFDETPTANSNNPVKSKGIKNYVDSKTNTNQMQLLTENTDYTVTVSTNSYLGFTFTKAYKELIIRIKNSNGKVYGDGVGSFSAWSNTTSTDYALISNFIGAIGGNTINYIPNKTYNEIHLQARNNCFYLNSIHFDSIYSGREICQYKGMIKSTANEQIKIVNIYRNAGTIQNDNIIEIYGVEA